VVVHRPGPDRYPAVKEQGMADPTLFDSAPHDNGTCACGCGRPLRRAGQRFLWGHNWRNRRRKPVTSPT